MPEPGPGKEGFGIGRSTGIVGRGAGRFIGALFPGGVTGAGLGFAMAPIPGNVAGLLGMP